MRTTPMITTQLSFRSGDLEMIGAMEAGMKKVVLDGASWQTKDDFYSAFFKAVGAPSWHGRNFNALRDSIVTGQINKIELPYTIYISGFDEMPAEVSAIVKDFVSLIKELHSQGHEVDVVCEGEPS